MPDWGNRPRASQRARYRLRQNAIVWCGDDGIPQLLLLRRQPAAFYPHTGAQQHEARLPSCLDVFL
jgi:transposase